MSLLIHSIPAWIELAFLGFSIGILACRLWVLPPAVMAELPDHERLRDRLRLYFSISVAAILVGGIVDLLLRTSEMSGRPAYAVFSLLPVVVFKTHFGRIWLIRIACLILASQLAQIRRRHADSSGLLYSLLALGAIISATESATGHASDAGDFSVTEIMDWFHLLAALVWGGGLFVLSFVVLPHLMKAGSHAAQALAGVAARFSKIAGIAIMTIVFTALYNAGVSVGSVEALVKTPYGRTVIAKIVLLFLFLFLGGFNRFVSVPRLREWAGFAALSRGTFSRLFTAISARVARNTKGHPVALRLVHCVRAEAILVAAVLLCAALLRHEVPARHFLHLEQARVVTTTGAETIVELKTNPEKIVAGVPVAMTVFIKDLNGRPLKGLVVSHERVLHAFIIGKDLGFFAHIHPEDIGPVTAEMLKKAEFPLRFVFPKAGEYLVGLDFATTDNYISEFYTEVLSVSVSGRPALGGPKIDFSRKKNFGNYRVTLVTFPKNVKAGEETTLRYSIEKNGKTLTDLEPYLGAEMHLAVASQDLTVFIHTHGAAPGESHVHHDPLHAKLSKKFGPELEANVLFPEKGVYKLFDQVKHQGKVLLFDFMIDAQ